MESRIDIHLLTNQSDDVIAEIGKKPSTIINLSNHSKRFYTFFSNERKLALECLRKLLGHAALGEWNDAKSIWKLFPDLLTSRGTIYHPNPITITPEMNPGRYKYVNHTAWQIALMNEEYEIAEEMAKFIDENEKQTQFAEIFPRGKIESNLDIEEAKRLLNILFNAVIDDEDITKVNLNKMCDFTRVALDTLYNYVSPAPKHATGLVFNAGIYVEAMKLYEEKFGLAKNWDQRSFWCIRVEEYLASLLGTCYLRQHVQGIMNTVKPSGCTLVDGTSYLSFRRPSSSIPGFHYFVGLYGLTGTFAGLGGAGFGGCGRIYFQDLINQNQATGEDLARRYYCDNTIHLAY